ncbi:TetR/AcrR family transcriptional regulator [Brevibacillus formosus]|uniref:TetR family transcriptional regulator n=1 Tax=Brevibacillus formosus TaxID=54913 RepID=A0A837KUB6_9BACL|nr:TetR/AcrR family transcriptional regulator [Brevibacillus formosus]KLI00417.1 TetR family transcriptional regulator [Brevibacillus formosus]MED1958722.1 TetR/AcrR family transcriptional regulator [Brevibacillus formosus]PSJ92415.1 TetR/AcrR family transcriptional regulator [Brevibacillus formosus]GED57795.1 TetR family transcriptional regulator [Brevibacillus formosus]
MSKDNKTHQHIVDAAFQLFAEHGIEKTSLTMIATEVGITKPAIYYHFASKEALLDYLFDQLFGNYTFAHFFTITDFTADNFAKLLIENGLKLLPSEEEDYAVLRVFNQFLLSVSQKEKYRDKLRLMQEDFLQGFTSLLERGIELGVVKPDRVVAKAHILALVVDNISNYMLMGIELDQRDIWTETVRSVLK